MPQLPRRSVRRPRWPAPAAQHLAHSIVELGQLTHQVLGRATNRGGETPHYHRIDVQRVVSHSRNLTSTRECHNSPVTPPVTEAPRRAQVQLLTRDGCTICARVHARLCELAEELGFDLSTTDVDTAASGGNPGLRAEFGDRLPVILLDGREHSYWDIDEARLRADLAR